MKKRTRLEMGQCPVWGIVFRELLGLGEELLGFLWEIRTAFKPRLGQFFTTVSFHQRLCFVSKLFS